MFDDVARKYDRVNDLLSLGQTRRWRKRVVRIIDPKPGMSILDIAAGPGSSSEPLQQAGADVVALDFSEGMLTQGRKVRPKLTFVRGDALQLPFPDHHFDLTTISFGIRNTNDYEKALREAYRVTKPGGRMVIVEFSTPTNKLFRNIYLNYLMRLLPRVARLTSSNPDAYVYLAESIRAWPDQSTFAAKMSANGWLAPTWVNLTGGVVAVHTGNKPL